MKSPRYAADVVVSQAFDDPRSVDVQIAVISGYARLAKVIEAPGPHDAPLINGEVMVEPRKYLRDLSAGEADGSRSESTQLVAAESSTTQLRLLSRAPSIDVPRMSQSKNVVRPACELLDVFEGRNLTRSRLKFLSEITASRVSSHLCFCKPKRTVIALFVCELRRRRLQCGSNARRMFPNRIHCRLMSR
jgi:hypothetical protein